MREVRRSALVAQPPGRMFALINDIESYPRFLPWCTAARVLARTPLEIVASIGVRRGVLTAEFTTRNELDPERRIGIRLVSGPFKTLEGEWLLTPVDTLGCRIELRLRFAFASALAGLVFESLFEETVGSLVDAFVARARALGNGGEHAAAEEQ